MSMIYYNTCPVKSRKQLHTSINKYLTRVKGLGIVMCALVYYNEATYKGGENL